MSSIYKLSICGVRSFDPERSETIQFGFPLTLICGQNGCGKTTIIECLKYSTTGDLPPNSKGGAFIHDPKLVYKQEVRAQVKLAFSNANGKSMICTRSMQLSKKRGRGNATGSITFKTLEGQLAIMNRGERSTISTKNAELDTQIPLYLGASKAILDYVIFCHQDDSLWPLSEASVLKKRFDDIFEASKFTKVLDNLKVIRKDMLVDMKLYEQSVGHLKIDKERASRIKSKMQKMEQTVEEYTTEISNLTQEIEKVEQQTDELFRSNQEFQQVLSRLENLKAVQKSQSEQSERLKNSIELLNDSNEQLLEQLNNFETKINDRIADAETKKAEIESLTNKVSRMRQQHNKYIREEATLKSKEEAYLKNIEERNELIQNNDEFGSIEDIQTFKNNLQTAFETLKENKEKLFQSNQLIRSKLVTQCRSLDNKIASKTQQIIHSDRSLEEINTKYKSTEKHLETLKYSEGNLELEKSELNDLEEKLKTNKEKGTIQELQRKIDEKNLQLSQLEVELDDIMKKITTSNKKSDIFAKLSLLNDSRDQKVKSLKSLIDFHKETFYNEVGEDLNIANCEKLLNAKISESIELMESTEDLYKVSKKKLDDHILSIKNDESLLEDYEKQEKNLKDTIFNVIDEDQLASYEDLLIDLENNYRDALDALNTLEVTKQFNTKAIEISEKEKKCSLCFRDFNTAELSKFTDVLKERINNMNIETLNNDCQEAKSDLESAKSINSDVLVYRKLIGQIEDLKSKIAYKKTQSEDLTTSQNKYSKMLLEQKAIVSKLNSLQKPITDISRLQIEKNALDNQIEGLEDNLNDYAGSMMSGAELQALHQQKSYEIKALRDSLNEANDEKFARQREISRFEGSIKDKRLVISGIEKSLMDKTNLQNSLKDLEERREMIKLEKESVELDLSELNELKIESEKKLNDVESDHKLEEAKLNEELYKLEKASTQFTIMEKSIEDFEINFKPKLNETMKKVISFEEDLSDLEKTIQEKEQELKTLENLVTDSSSLFKNIQANLDYRNLLKEIDEVANQIDELNVLDAEKKRNKYQEESRRLRNLSSELNAQHAGKIGEVRQMQDQIKSFVSELQNEYKDIDNQYHQEWVKLQTNILASDDIQTYSKALDNAIMKYHSIKMKDINRIIDELWKQTYKGSDVDTISIKSDVTLQTKGNRSYNYRVVMYKSGAELDMRGRCSAGQKVLASIIIRLALAECFGVNCGMIALDEPTTNLDSDNIESLAEALNLIIDTRKRQKNFQLIVITHDEKFLSHINGDKFTDHFYRIQRDELQKSAIRKLPINFIQEE